MRVNLEGSVCSAEDRSVCAEYPYVQTKKDMSIALSVDGYYKRFLGEKRYEMVNHLGNVLVVITDRRFSFPDGGTGNVLYYEPDVMAAQDYDPFGMNLVGRNWVDGSENYRFGFNGQEQDDEVSGEGNQYDYGFRIYNPRIGKFLSVDPLTKKYAELTPYQFASNMPIRCIDLDGLEGYQVVNKYANVNGVTTLISKTVDIDLQLPFGYVIVTDYPAKPNSSVYTKQTKWISAEKATVSKSKELDNFWAGSIGGSLTSVDKESWTETRDDIVNGIEESKANIFNTAKLESKITEFDPELSTRKVDVGNETFIVTDQKTITSDKLVTISDYYVAIVANKKTATTDDLVKSFVAKGYAVIFLQSDIPDGVSLFYEEESGETNAIAVSLRYEKTTTESIKTESSVVQIESQSSGKIVSK